MIETRPYYMKDVVAGLVDGARDFLWSFALKHLKPPAKPADKPDVGTRLFCDASVSGRYVGTFTLPENPNVIDLAALALLKSSMWNLDHAEGRGIHGGLRGSTFRYTAEWNIKFEPAVGPSEANLDPATLRMFVGDLLASAENMAETDPAEPEIPEPEPDLPPRVLSLADARKAREGANILAGFVGLEIPDTDEP